MGNSVNHDKYCQLKQINKNGINLNHKIESIGFLNNLKSPIYHKRNNSNITEAYNINKENSFASNNSYISFNRISDNKYNINHHQGEILDNKNNLFNIKSRRLEQKNLYNPKYNEK